MNIGDKVFVSDWGKIYSDFYRWVNGEKESIYKWETEIPNYSSINFHWEYEYKPKLTQKGVPYKNGDKELVSKYPKYKDYEYTLLECYHHPKAGQISTDLRTKEKPNASVFYYPERIWLAKSDEGCFIQIEEKGLTTLTPEEQEKVKHLEKKKHLQALAKDNLGKWSINDNTKDFPKELLKYLYDSEQRTCFGSEFPNTKAIITYSYISKEYTLNGNDICLGWSQNFNGVGCDLSDKDIISWNELPKRFPENTFKG